MGGGVWATTRTFNIGGNIAGYVAKDIRKAAKSLFEK
jgi:hypothetical protein